VALVLLAKGGLVFHDEDAPPPGLIHRVTLMGPPVRR
jgi:hypothetical protein